MFVSWRQSRFDFRNARGAVHLRYLEEALPRLEQRIVGAHSALDALRREIEALTTQRTAEYQAVIARGFVLSTTRGPPGVGPVLWNRVVSSCFDGTLGSLRNARMVGGIGDQRAAAIQAWVTEAEREMQRQLKSDFPRKKEISERYERLLRGKVEPAEAAEKQYRYLVEIQATAEAERKRLRAVRASTFRSAYKGERVAAEQIIRFLIGAYPPWEPPPTWYEALPGRAPSPEAFTTSGASPMTAVQPAFRLGLDGSGSFVITVRGLIDGKWVRIPEPLRLFDLGFTFQSGSTRFSVARQCLGGLLAIWSLHPRAASEGTLVAKPTPLVLAYLRSQNYVKEDESCKLLQILGEPPQRLALVDYDPKQGLHVSAGYELPGQRNPVPAEALHVTPDGHFVEVGNVFAPIPSPPSSEASKWLRPGGQVKIGRAHV